MQTHRVRCVEHHEQRFTFKVEVTRVIGNHVVPVNILIIIEVAKRVIVGVNHDGRLKTGVHRGQNTEEVQRRTVNLVIIPVRAKRPPPGHDEEREASRLRLRNLPPNHTIIQTTIVAKHWSITRHRTTITIPVQVSGQTIPHTVLGTHQKHCDSSLAGTAPPQLG